jgi:hypothetical protein
LSQWYQSEDSKYRRWRSWRILTRVSWVPYPNFTTPI